MKRNLRAAIAAAEDAGLEVTRVETGKHYKLHVRTPAGAECMVVVPITGSDHRGEKNLRALLRRISAGENVCRQHTGNRSNP